MRSLNKRSDSKSTELKRGEKEAISLRRRRLMKNTINIASVTAVCVLVVGSIYLWRTGTVSVWIDNTESKAEELLVDAGLIVENVDIVGTQFLSEEEVLTVSGVKRGDALLSLNIEDVINSVELLEWVKTASVRRDFAGDIVISVQEHQPAAIWQVNNKLWIVSDEGIQISDRQLEYFADLPMIRGFGAEKNLEELVKTVASNKALFERVEFATWMGGRRWDLMLKNGINIMLPEGDMVAAWEELTELEKTEQLLSRNILVVDFRIKGKTVVRLTPEEAERRRLLAQTSGEEEEI